MRYTHRDFVAAKVFRYPSSSASAGYSAPSESELKYALLKDVLIGGSIAAMSRWIRNLVEAGQNDHIRDFEKGTSVGVNNGPRRTESEASGISPRSY